MVAPPTDLVMAVVAAHPMSAVHVMITILTVAPTGVPVIHGLIHVLVAH
jgi:hypothetical protein